MPVFEVLTPRDMPDPFETELVADRFSLSAALVPPLWALLHDMWLESVEWGIGVVMIAIAGLFIGGAAAFWLYVIFALWIGFAAPDLRIAALKRAGYGIAGTRIARDELLAERDWLLETSK